MSELYARMTMREKFRRVLELCDLTRKLALAGLRREFPDASERELRLRLAARMYGEELVREAFGWPPDDGQG